MPRAPKHRDLRSNTERRDLGPMPSEDSPDAAPVVVPKPLSSWLRKTKDSWERYWGSPARHATILSLDLETLERLWTLYDERERAQRELRKARLVLGSQGQTRPSGFYRVIATLDAEIRQLEDRVAKSMKSRLILGMVVGGDRPSDDQPDDEGSERPDRSGDRELDDSPTYDPRLYVVGGRAG